VINKRKHALLLHREERLGFIKCLFLVGYGKDPLVDKLSGWLPTVVFIWLLWIIGFFYPAFLWSRGA
jgi:hypothetical protein